MAIDSLIPRRPQCIESKLTVLDKNCIEYAAAFSAKNEEAFLLFHPEYITSDGKLSNEGKRRCKDFFSYSKNKEYRDAYTAYLKEFLSKKERPKSEASAIIDDARKDNARVALYNKVIRLIEGDDELDPDTLKIAVDMAKKLSIVADDTEEQVIKPIRFLPERCFSDCRYRLFVENAVKGGSVIDECQYCKALAYATENGYKDDATKRLDIPKEVLDAEPENTVKTLDILSGKIEN